MATTASIYNQIANTAAQQTALAELTPSPDTVNQLQADLASTSKVSVWRLYMWLHAYAQKLQRDLWDLFKVDVEGLAKDGHFGTRRWFAAKALKFQFGHALQFTDLDAFYAVDDPAARIVKKVAVVELANRVLVKVAKANGFWLQKLDPPELLAVNDYFQELRPPVQVTVITADPDRLRIYGAVIYDAQTTIFTAQNGVQMAVQNYLKELEFGGIMRLTDLKEAMLSAPGVVDVRLDQVQARTQGDWMTISRLYTSYAGHMRLDPLYNLPITMTWQVGNV